MVNDRPRVGPGALPQVAGEPMRRSRQAIETEGIAMMKVERLAWPRLCLRGAGDRPRRPREDSSEVGQIGLAIVAGRPAEACDDLARSPDRGDV